jgi:hypothetical protein
MGLTMNLPLQEGKEVFAVLYDETGRVLHVHKHVSFSGQKPSRDVVENKIRQLARRLGYDESKLKVLHADSLPSKPGQKLHVDVERSVLIATGTPRDAAPVLPADLPR